MTILVDTREKRNEHIIKYLDSNNLHWTKETLNVGDYSFMIPADNSLGIVRDMYFNNLFVIERKAGLDELSNNFTKDRDRFQAEFYRGSHRKIVLLVEDATLNDMISHKYRSQLKEKAFIASLFSFQHRFNLNINFIDKVNAGLYIYMSCYYYLNEYLKKA
jgi:ERCC4-type nuclease